MKTSMEYAKAVCETMMRKYKAEELPPKGHFHYHQGVFLSGVYEIYQLCGEEKYFAYIKDWVDSVMDEEGQFYFCHAGGDLDDIQPGVLLFPLLECTSEKKYQQALDYIMNNLKCYPKNKQGGYWHKDIFVNQMWLDGLYMAGPISAAYAKKYQKKEFLEEAVFQSRLMEAKTRDEKTGLWHHAYDETLSEDWADKKTGRSPEFWGRSLGWVPNALLDELDHIDPRSSYYEEVSQRAEKLLRAVCNYQSESGLWYQVVDKVGEKGNWPELSCSCLFVAALCKAVRKGILGKEYLTKALHGYHGITQRLKWEEEDLIVGHVCVGTGVGSYEYYCQRPVSANDLHGVGAFLLMCTEVCKSEEL